MKVQPLCLLAGAGLTFALPEALSLEKRVCPHDNLLRCLIATPSLAIPYCSSSVGIYPTAVTVLVTSVPTVSVTATSTGYSTATSTSTVHETDTATIGTTTSTTTTVAGGLTTTITMTSVKARTATVTVQPPGGFCAVPVQLPPRFIDAEEVKRAAPATSLACIAKLAPGPSAVSSACSCFSGSYAPSIPPVTSTVTLEPTTITATTQTTTVPVTVGQLITVTEWTTVTTTSTVVVTSTCVAGLR